MITLLKEKLKEAIKKVYEVDFHLLKEDVHEQSITGRIAHYFENLILSEDFYRRNMLSVDIEYNKNMEDSKKVYKNCHNCNLNECFIKTKNEIFSYKYNGTTKQGNPNNYIGDYHSGKPCRPDIILHKRGCNCPTNFLVCEIKKIEDNYSNINNKISDSIKLASFTCQKTESEYKYKLGVFIEISKNITNLYYFENGKETSNEIIHNSINASPAQQSHHT